MLVSTAGWPRPGDEARDSVQPQAARWHGFSRSCRCGCSSAQRRQPSTLSQRVRAALGALLAAAQKLASREAACRPGLRVAVARRRPELQLRSLTATALRAIASHRHLVAQAIQETRAWRGSAAAHSRSRRPRSHGSAGACAPSPVARRHSCTGPLSQTTSRMLASAFAIDPPERRDHRQQPHVRRDPLLALVALPGRHEELDRPLDHDRLAVDDAGHAHEVDGQVDRLLAFARSSTRPSRSALRDRPAGRLSNCLRSGSSSCRCCARRPPARRPTSTAPVTGLGR